MKLFTEVDWQELVSLRDRHLLRHPQSGKLMIYFHNRHPMGSSHCLSHEGHWEVEKRYMHFDDNSFRRSGELVVLLKTLVAGRKYGPTSKEFFQKCIEELQ